MAVDQRGTEALTKLSQLSAVAASRAVLTITGFYYAGKAKSCGPKHLLRAGLVVTENGSGGVQKEPHLMLLIANPAAAVAAAESMDHLERVEARLVEAKQAGMAGVANPW